MPKSHNYLVRNQTPRELVLLGDKHVIRLAPLQNRPVRDHPIVLFGQAARFAKHDHAVDWEAEPVRAKRILLMAWFAGAAFALLALGIAGGLLLGRAWPYVAGGVLCAVFLMLVGYAATRMDTPGDDTREVSRSASGQSRRAAERDDWWDLAPRRSDTWDLTRDLAIAVLQGLVVVLLAIVAIGAPALAIYYGTELPDVLVAKSWDNWTLVHGVGTQYIVVARCLQLGLLILMSILPGLMFYQFDREKLSTLVDRWLHAIFRLDPSLRTVSDVDAKYGRRVEEFFGASLAVGIAAPRRRLRNRTPVVTTTLLIAIGWIVVLVNTRDKGSGLPTLQELFSPVDRPMALAFLGAYFLSIQVVLRGYIRGDLKPKTYNVLSARIVMAVILAWVLQALLGTNTTTLALSFLAGITPNTVLRRIRDISVFDWAKQKVPSAFGRKPGRPEEQDDLNTQLPLSLIDEIDVYERTRLEEEGITCVQALARHDFVDLMLSSRIPVPRLVDWMDQAVLFQHVPPAPLRALSIRNACDLLRVLEGLSPDSSDPEVRSQRKALSDALGSVSPEWLQAELLQDEWLRYVRNWREHDGTLGDGVLVYDNEGRPHDVPRAADGSAPSMLDLRDAFPAGVAPAAQDVVLPDTEAQQSLLITAQGAPVR